MQKQDLRPSPSGSELRSNGGRDAVLQSANVISFPDNPYGQLIRLRETLTDVFAEIIKLEDGFLLFVSRESGCRLWIDDRAWVESCKDTTCHRFVLNTRRGRQTLLETNNIQMLADIAAHYIAARIIKSSRLQRLM